MIMSLPFPDKEIKHEVASELVVENTKTSEKKRKEDNTAEDTTLKFVKAHKTTVFIAVGIIVLLIAIFVINSYAPIDWVYDSSDCRTETFKDVSVTIPNKYESTEYEDSMFLASDKDKAWLEICYVGEFDSIKELKNKIKEDYYIEGCKVIKLKGEVSDAVAYEEYQSSGGDRILSYGVLVGKNGYWIAVGARETNCYKTEVAKQFLDSCKYKKR